MPGKTDSLPDLQPPFVRRLTDGIELRLKVIPGASRAQIVGVLGDRLKVKVTEAPEQGQANRAVLKLLQQWLGTPAIAIVAGHGQAEKTVSVAGLPGLTAAQLRHLK